MLSQLPCLIKPASFISFPSPDSRSILPHFFEKNSMSEAMAHARLNAEMMFSIYLRTPEEIKVFKDWLQKYLPDAAPQDALNIIFTSRRLKESFDEHLVRCFGIKRHPLKVGLLQSASAEQNDFFCHDQIMIECIREFCRKHKIPMS